MSVHRHGGEALHDRVYFYFACPKCGWCSPLKPGTKQAQRSGRRHRAAKAKAA